jgi:uncharacterized protein YecE (DUF72 family)
MAEQLDLFGTAPRGDARRPVARCDGDPRGHLLAGGLPEGLRLGTSSWSFPGWQDILYAGHHTSSTLARCGLSAYSAHPWLGTVGLDSTYYALPNRQRLADYAAQVPPRFRFLVKAPALVTDPLRRAPGARPTGPNPSFLDVGLASEQVIGPVLDGLADRAGVLLFQFPPLGAHWTAVPRRFAETLYRFLSRLPTGPRYAVELRDARLLTPDLAEALRHGGAHPGLCVHPRLPGLEQQRRVFARLAPGPLILRWVLRPNRGYDEAKTLYRPFDRLHEPDPDHRRLIAGLAGEALAADQEVYVIVNNKAEGCAPLSLLALMETPPLSGLGSIPAHGLQMTTRKNFAFD